MERTSFTATTGSGAIAGWVMGEGPPVLALHDGPALSYDYLDELGWDTAYLMGHSWGGHLAFHAATTIPDRLSGVLAIDPLGAVGDGGAAEFMAELVVRMPDANRPRFDELEAKEAALPSISVPVGVLVGERSPIPTKAGTDTADQRSA